MGVSDLHGKMNLEKKTLSAESNAKRKWLLFTKSWCKLTFSPVQSHREWILLYFYTLILLLRVHPSSLARIANVQHRSQGTFLTSCYVSELVLDRWQQASFRIGLLYALLYVVSCYEAVFISESPNFCFYKS